MWLHGGSGVQGRLTVALWSGCDVVMLRPHLAVEGLVGGLDLLPLAVATGRHQLQDRVLVRSYSNNSGYLFHPQATTTIVTVSVCLYAACSRTYVAPVR